MKDFDSFGIMLPVSYKSSMSIPTMKSFFKTISEIGYNQIFLYNEDKIEVYNEPYHGYERGRVLDYFEDRDESIEWLGWAKQ